MAVCSLQHLAPPVFEISVSRSKTLITLDSPSRGAFLQVLGPRCSGPVCVLGVLGNPRAAEKGTAPPTRTRTRRCSFSQALSWGTPRRSAFSAASSGAAWTRDGGVYLHLNSRPVPGTRVHTHVCTHTERQCALSLLLQAPASVCCEWKLRSPRCYQGTGSTGKMGKWGRRMRQPLAASVGRRRP